MRWFRTATSASSSPAQTRASAVAPVEPGVSLFLAAADRVTAQLAGSTGVDTWLVNRRSDELFTVLSGASTAQVVPVGTTLPWADTHCSAMVLDQGPRIAPDVLTVPAYASKPVTARLGIRTYVGVPLVTRAGELLGTICGITDHVVPVELIPTVVELEDQALELTDALQRELNAVRAERGQDVVRAYQQRDELTGLADRRGWGMLLAREEARATRYAEPDGVLVLDLGAVTSAKAVRRAADAAAEVSRGRAAVARIGGRQLGFMCAGRTTAEVESLAVEISEAVRATGCSVTVGWSLRTGDRGLTGAWQLAEERLMVARRTPALA